MPWTHPVRARLFSPASARTGALIVTGVLGATLLAAAPH